MSEKNPTLFLTISIIVFALIFYSVWWKQQREIFNCNERIDFFQERLDSYGLNANKNGSKMEDKIQQIFDSSLENQKLTANLISNNLFMKDKISELEKKVESFELKMETSQSLNKTFGSFSSQLTELNKFMDAMFLNVEKRGNVQKPEVEKIKTDDANIVVEKKNKSIWKILNPFSKKENQ